jgi:hypothetical protein
LRGIKIFVFEGRRQDLDLAVAQREGREVLQVADDAVRVCAEELAKSLPVFFGDVLDVFLVNLVELDFGETEDQARGAADFVDVGRRNPARIQNLCEILVANTIEAVR